MSNNNNAYVWGEDFYVLSEVEHADLMDALAGYGNAAWAQELRADFSYTSDKPGYEGMFFAPLSKINPTEAQWLKNNGFVFEYEFFVFSQYPTQILG